MNRLYKPFLLFFTVTIPQLLVLGILSRIFYLISSELSKESVRDWTILGTYLVVCCIGITVYSINSLIFKNEIHPYGAIIILLAYTILLAVYFFVFIEMIPADIPSWMLLGLNPGISLLTFTMPALVHSMLILVHWSSEKYQVHNYTIDVLALIGIPICWYLIILIPYDNIGLSFNIFEVLMPILFVVGILIFYFLFIRIVYVVVKRKLDFNGKGLAALVLVGAFMGLLLNQNLNNLFGDFSAYSFYICTLITGILMFIPEVDHKIMRLTLFVAKSITFIFSTYFFIVFLPYLPLAVVGLIVFGAGLLMLAPLVLMFVHIRSLWSDFNYLDAFYNKKHLIILFVVGVLCIPSWLLIMISKDKYHLEQALRYTYQRSFEDKTTTEFNAAAIERALSNLKHSQVDNRNMSGLVAADTPYLTAFYSWYVLDNVSISNEKINKLETIFVGKIDEAEGEEFQIEEESTKDVVINSIKNDTKFDSKERVWKSWIHFELKNISELDSEYITSFELSEGSYISNYYLYVNNNKKYGLIADKRAANWIYQQIRNVNRDPGILTYLAGNKIEFKVFPFLANEMRKTGIEIIHRTPITIHIDEKVIELKNSKMTDDKNEKDENIYPGIAYISKEKKEMLKKIHREPKYYFVMDYSMGNDKNIQKYINRLNNYIDKNNIRDSVKEIIALNFNEKRVVYDKNWDNKFQDIKIQGGFNLDYTIKRIFYNSYKSHSNEYPVIVVVTDFLGRAVLPKDFEDYQFTSPEGAYYYHLNYEQSVTRFSLLSSKEKSEIKNADQIKGVYALEWKDQDDTSYYLADDHQDSIVLTDDQFEIPINDVKRTSWKNGVIMKAKYMNTKLHPEKSLQSSLNIVKQSITSNVMSPLTSYIVLENEAQEKVLLEKQKQILSTNIPVDIEDFIEMDEPPLFIIGLMGIGIFVYMKRRKNKKRIDTI